MRFASIPEAIEDFRLGKILVVVDDEDRENEGDLTIAADKITPEAINFMATSGRGLICLALDADICARLDLQPMSSVNTARFGTAFCEAIDAAVACRGRSAAGTVLHSDRGGEFTATLTAQACDRYDLKRSMGDTGICWDNSPAESFWSTFKHEHYYRHTFATKAELVAAVDNWILWYNYERRHSAIGMLSPIRYEHSLTGTAKAA